MIVHESAQIILDFLHGLEKEIDEEFLFNVAYIIPQVTLLEIYWHDQKIDDTFEVFVESLKELLEQSAQADKLSERDLEWIQGILSKIPM